jgi:2-iminobutanoate/2-iminopropanoate deaminase
MKQISISSPNAPEPVGPYSPSLVWGNLVFISGQGPIDPGTGKPVLGDIKDQVRQVFANLDSLLKASGSSRRSVLKVTVYLADMDNFKDMNTIYADYFQDVTFPARTTIEAARLPLDIGVEIDVIAFIES